MEKVSMKEGGDDIAIFFFGETQNYYKRDILKLRNF